MALGGETPAMSRRFSFSSKRATPLSRRAQALGGRCGRSSDSPWCDRGTKTVNSTIERAVDEVVPFDPGVLLLNEGKGSRYSDCARISCAASILPGTGRGLSKAAPFGRGIGEEPLRRCLFPLRHGDRSRAPLASPPSEVLGEGSSGVRPGVKKIDDAKGIRAKLLKRDRSPWITGRPAASSPPPTSEGGD